MVRNQIAGKDYLCSQMTWSSTEKAQKNRQKTNTCLPNPEPVSNYSKNVGYRIYIQSVNFLYTSNEQVEFQIANTVSFTLVLQNMKYLGINIK